MPSIIKHIPTRIAVYNGSAIEYAAKKTAIMPNIKINTDAILDIESNPKTSPTIPMNIITNATK